METITLDSKPLPLSFYPWRSLLRNYSICLFAFCFVVGCNSKSETPSLPAETAEPAQVVAPEKASPVVAIDDPDAVSAIEAVTNKVRRDGDGAIIEVDFRGTTIDDSNLEPLTKLPRLRSLLLAETAVTDNGMTVVGQLKALENLDIRECAIGDAGLSYLTPLAKLKALRLSGKVLASNVSDDGMQHVAKLPNLKVLALDYLWVSEEGLEKLTGLTDLQELYLAQTTIGNEAIAVIANFPQLRKLRLAKTQIDAQGIIDLPKLVNLEELDLSECAQLTDEAMQPLAELSKLTKLNLWRVAISDSGVEPLAGLTSLESLNLDNTQLSDQGMPSLSRLTNLTFLHLGSTLITDGGLAHLEGLKSLKDLKVTRTAVTAEGVAKLQEKLPETEIQLKYIEGQ